MNDFAARRADAAGMSTHAREPRTPASATGLSASHWFPAEGEIRFGRKTRPLSERFWERVKKTPTCWEWIGGKSGTGYGEISIGRRGFLAHRVSLEMATGTRIPAGLTVDHLCRNRGCVNPAHLELVSMGENVLRGEGITARHARQTHCKHGHALTEDNVYRWSKRNGRGCRECRRDADRKYELRRHRGR